MNRAEGGLLCPVPLLTDGQRISLAHGDGARLSQRLIQQWILPILGGDTLRELGDAAVLPAVDGPLAMTTDAFVVSPLVFPGGDIGSLAVTGTLNDLAVSGAQPLWIAVALILEEGFPLTQLETFLRSMKRVADEAGVQIVAGDTKVVPAGAADQMFVTTTGVGRMLPGLRSQPTLLQPTDQLIVTGPIAQHGLAVMTARESLAIQHTIRSDCGLLLPAVRALHAAGIPVRAMRDATRGGVAAVLHEWATASHHTLTLHERDIPLADEARGLCELLGLDPLLVANEGTMLLAVPQECAPSAIHTLRQTEIASAATIVGHVRSRDVAPVTIIRSLGRDVPLDLPAGAMLPRIC
ncbi:MAG: hydrogenase expression/formation protein HypE [Pirellulaceae bacterium]|nr:hydrogenase expression/formation protein HypE [Pirellulaceae bacterium]